MPETIVPRVIEEEMQQAYVDYAMSVIVGRALPDVRDGLKPVHRRILFAMHDLGMQHNKPYKKSARIVGEVLGKYHPHGDVAVYDSLVRMAQEWSMRLPLIDGQGNFGSVDGDSPAAMRYTEARLAKFSEELLEDIDKETVKFVDNFDGSLKEPTVLPSKAPNLLVNGSSGIAVGMATNIPPHNLGEVARAAVAFIDNQQVSTAELMVHIPGPDFPTGGEIAGRQGILSAYATGRGKVTVKATLEETEGRIVVTELPYMVNKAQLVEQIADLVRDKRIVGIRTIRDESNREGMRVVIELKQGAESALVVNQLYQYTNLRTTFGIIMLALVDGEPKVLDLKSMLEQFVKHRRVMVRCRVSFDLKKAQERSHLLAGLIIALNNIDAIVAGIKASKSTAEAREFLMGSFELSQLQADAILDMKLQKLSSLEQQKIRQEQEELLLLIRQLQEILASEQRILDIIKSELKDLEQRYSSPRRTRLSENGEDEVELEELIEERQEVVTITHRGYVKRLPLSTYRMQNRGGKGIVATGTKEEDIVEDVFVASTHSYLLFFTDKGQLYWLKVYAVPEASRQAAGKPVINLIDIQPGEKVTSVIPIRNLGEEKFVVMCTQRGVIKKTPLSLFANPRRGGIRAVTLEGDDELMSVVLADEQDQIIIATEDGLAVRFVSGAVRAMGRGAMGVRGIRLRGDDHVVGMTVARSGKNLLTITKRGFGKQTPIDEYRLINRGGKGVTNLRISEKNGKVVAVKMVEEGDEVMLISKKGIAIRVPLQSISVIGRATQGVRVMRLDEGDEVVAVARIANEEKDVEEAVNQQPPAGSPVESGNDEGDNADEGGDLPPWEANVEDQEFEEELIDPKDEPDAKPDGGNHE